LEVEFTDDVVLLEALEGVLDTGVTVQWLESGGHSAVKVGCFGFVD